MKKSSKSTEAKRAVDAYGITKEQLYDAYWNLKWSSRAIAKYTDKDHHTILYYMKKYNIPRRSYSESKIGILNPMWKDGISFSRGYKFIRKSMGRQRREHDLIMEKFIGRPLRKYEYVHHINGDKLDNHLENLLMCSPSEHTRIHEEAKR